MSSILELSAVIGFLFLKMVVEKCQEKLSYLLLLEYTMLECHFTGTCTLFISNFLFALTIVSTILFN